MVRHGEFPCCSFKLQFIDAFSNAIVGAPIRRPRSEMLRIRIEFRRIRKILPQRAPSGLPYDDIGKLQFTLTESSQIHEKPLFSFKNSGFYYI